jgi:HTH-type transcriptional regulator/antitoxin HipB
MNVTEGWQLQALTRDRRLALGLSQEAVATRAEVSRKWVSEFERGKPSADLSLVLRLLVALGLQVEVHCPESEEDDAAVASPSSTAKP